MTAEEASCSSKQDEGDFSQKEVDTLISEGKKLSANRDPQGASDKFAEACCKLAEKFGQTADECGDVYLLYGRSLLDIARSESDFLGNSIPKGPDSTSKEEAEQQADGAGPSGVQEKMDEDKADVVAEEAENKNGEAAQQEKQSKEEGGPTCSKSEDDPENGENKGGDKENEEKETVDNKDGDNEVDDKENGESENGDSKNGDNKDSDEENGDTESGDNENDTAEDDADEGEDVDGETEAQEEVPTMQRAWEMLELARIVFARHETKEKKLKQADANLALGEIGMELEHYPEAVGDYMECLRIQEQFLEPSDRLLAETYYSLGLSYSFERHYGKSIEYFNKAIKVIELRIKNLKDDTTMDESTKTAELNDLQELLPDLQAKVEDSEYMKKSTEEIIKSASTIAKENLGEGTTTTGFDEPSVETNGDTATTTQVKVANISHLVRKKRKATEGDEAGGKRHRENGEADAAEE
eukprot:Seg2482.4 transcript_id=Seg2482.4/GoldUCD/mRNA.D3Y31 product="Protein HGV2" protein_id=Seg2482.4/GoldUCD/D3Y31